MCVAINIYIYEYRAKRNKPKILRLVSQTGTDNIFSFNPFLIETASFLARSVRVCVCVCECVCGACVCVCVCVCV